MTLLKRKFETRSWVNKARTIVPIFVFGKVVFLSFVWLELVISPFAIKKVSAQTAEQSIADDENFPKFKTIKIPGFSAIMWISPDRFISQSGAGPKTAIFRLHDLDGKILDQINFNFTINCLASWGNEQIFSPRLEDKSYKIELVGSQRSKMQISHSQDKCLSKPVGMGKGNFMNYNIDGTKLHISTEYYEFEQADGVKIRFRKTPFQRSRSSDFIHIYKNENRTLISPILNYTLNIARRELAEIGFQYFEIKDGKVSAKSLLLSLDTIDEDLFYRTGLRAKPIAAEGVVLMNSESIWFYHKGESMKVRP